MRIIYTLLLCAVYNICHAQQSITCTVYFDSDKAVPTPTSQIALDKFLDSLRRLSVNTIVVKGYTDKKGGSEYNLNLSTQRASNIAEQLKEQLPATAFITTQFYGDKDLLTEDDEAQAQNRRVQLIITFLPPAQQNIKVESFYQDVEEQRFTVNLNDTVLIKGKEGTFIKIPPGSIQTQDGDIVKGTAQLLLKEYYNPGDIVLAGMNSSSTQGLLQTGGMFKLELMQDGKLLSTQTKNEVEIRVPVRDQGLTGMNVFTMDNHADSMLWANTNKVFKQTLAYWDWPKHPRLADIYAFIDVNFNNFRTGARYEEEYTISRDLFQKKESVPLAKKIKVAIQKTDSATLLVKAQIKYRHKGFKRLGIHGLDTSFTVPFIRSEYITQVSNLNYINCDRFLNSKNLTELYVNTPGFQGLNVMAYFKSQSGYMQAFAKNNRFVISKVPAAETVYLIAFGRKGADYYFARQPYTITKKDNVNLSLVKMDEAAFKKELKSL